MCNSICSITHYVEGSFLPSYSWVHGYVYIHIYHPFVPTCLCLMVGMVAVTVFASVVAPPLQKLS
jgi:hypothetical protein